MVLFLHLFPVDLAIPLHWADALFEELLELYPPDDEAVKSQFFKTTLDSNSSSILSGSSLKKSIPVKDSILSTDTA